MNHIFELNISFYIGTEERFPKIHLRAFSKSPNVPISNKLAQETRVKHQQGNAYLLTRCSP